MGVPRARQTPAGPRPLEGGDRAPVGRESPDGLPLAHHRAARGGDLAATAPRTRAGRPTKLAPYPPIIHERLTVYPELSAVRLFEEIRAAGYGGGITQLRDYVARVRPRPEPEPVVRFETPPGLQAQVDFADVRLPWGKRAVLLVVLGYSRLLWLHFYPRKTLAVLLQGLEAAFGYFGGVLPRAAVRPAQGGHPG